MLGRNQGLLDIAAIRTPKSREKVVSHPRAMVRSLLITPDEVAKPFFSLSSRRPIGN